ncbi:hypothetical protein DOTSEDRAFT_113771, partial [Dothistroma septosporum NZE10]
TPSTAVGASTTMAKETPYLKTLTAALVSSEPSIETWIEKSDASVAKPGDPPLARELRIIHDKSRDIVAKFMTRRGEICDRSMRQLVQRRKERLQIEREQEAERAEKERAKMKREQDEKRRREKRETLPNVGAHGLARQDGVGVHQEPMDTADTHSDSGESRAEQPAAAPLYERIFGKDPTKGNDPIIYDIRELKDEMTVEEKRAILNVKVWPESDLSELTAGDPPDADFSNAKPANQVNFSTFQTYIEPYIRPYTEEDVAVLKERGDRITPYVLPPRGNKGYRELWAAEDGTTGIEPPQKHVNNPNEARGSMEDMEDDIADQDTVSMGPLMSRLTSVIRPAPNPARKDKDNDEDANGDISMVNGDAEGEAPAPVAGAEEFKPVSYLPPDAARPANLASQDYETFEMRALQELRYIGLLASGEVPNYDSHEDDEVSARLRTLQHELRRVSRINNVRKARVLELTEERMAMQEYSNIADDLDNQVNAAYLKRNRSLAKPNQKKGSQARPGQKGVASGVAGRGVSDGVRALMQKRRDWNDMVGPVVRWGRPEIPGDDQSIFDEATLKRLEKLEREADTAEAE